LTAKRVKVIDQIYNRWLLDGEFRSQMDENPAQALASYDLTDKEWVQMSRLSRKVRLQAKKSSKNAVRTLRSRSCAAPAVVNLPTTNWGALNLN
jgi:hypothetical protein